MAVRNRPASGFRGGIGRWVPTEEAREIRAQLGRIRTVGALEKWLAAPLAVSLGPATVMLGYRVRLGASSDKVSAARWTEGLIVNVAASRRHDAVRAFARERGIDLAAMLELACECATCGRPLTRGTLSPFYCDEHRDEERAELAELLPPKRRSTSSSRRGSTRPRVTPPAAPDVSIAESCRQPDTGARAAGFLLEGSAAPVSIRRGG
jgi:hypothetical protein